MPEISGIFSLFGMGSKQFWDQKVAGSNPVTPIGISQ